ncbi:sialidase family protein [Halomontanus rarus]|uniref:sialidase family protein n=1 Tax=Halomontanus rarus TaxID=3034020 RepID=UPI0023E76687|nr:sialidase family protein [Halovivax sp. TS33]
MVDKFDVSRDTGIYEAFPDVTLTDDGRLLCVFVETTHHADRQYSCIVLVESFDRGRTWSEKRQLTQPKTATDDAFWDCPRIATLPDGRLAAIVNEVPGSLGEYGSGVTETRNYLLFSDDGRSWSDPLETPTTGIVPDQPVELTRGEHTGRWLVTTHSPTGAGASETCWEVTTWLTDDEGDTWTGPITVASDSELRLCEASVLELPGGELVCILRENSGDGKDAYKAISHDGGETWKGVYRMPIPGCHRPVAGLLNDERVLITHRFMQGGSGWLGSWTQNTFAVLTDVDSCLARERDDAHARILPLEYDRSPNADTGYTGWIQFDDGEIYVVNYLVDDAPETSVRRPREYRGEYDDVQKAFVRGYSLSPEEFLLE